jgi:hypothetical protein
MNDDNGACKKCGSLLRWATCWKCGGEGVDGHDCGDDTCCCLNPDDNLVCDNCDGEGGYYLCPSCNSEAFE